MRENIDQNDSDYRHFLIFTFYSVFTLEVCTLKSQSPNGVNIMGCETVLFTLESKVKMVRFLQYPKLH